MKWLDDKKTTMGLYDINGESIDVYKLEPKSDEIYNYKKNELKKIDIKKIAYVATTYEGEPILKRGHLSKGANYTYMNGGGSDYDRKTNIKSSSLSFCEKDMYNHIIEKHQFKPWDKETGEKLGYKLTKKDLIEKYCNEVGPSTYLKVIDDAHIGVDALILLSRVYDYDHTSYYEKRIFPEILNVPTTLYNLELFLHGNFDRLELEELKKILNLYKSINEPIYSTKLNDLKEMYKYLPIPGADIESQIRIHEGDAKVLSLLRK